MGDKCKFSSPPFSLNVTVEGHPQMIGSRNDTFDSICPYSGKQEEERAEIASLKGLAAENEQSQEKRKKQRMETQDSQMMEQRL